MARIIDLKNRPIEPESEEGQSSVSPKNDFLPARTISWTGRLHPDVSSTAVIATSLLMFAIAALIQIFQKSFITTTFFALLGLVVLLNMRRKSDVGSFEINPAGVKANDRMHHFQEIKSFWIEYDPALGIKELSLQLKKWYAPYVKMPIENQNPVQLRLALLEFLPEVEHKDSIADVLSRKLGL